jgi:hypothetical protein
MLRSLLCGAMVLASPIPSQQPMDFVQYPNVHRVDCLEGKGTAFRIGGHHWISVAHVTALNLCQVGTEKINVTVQDGPNDFSEFDTQSVGNGFKVNCEGFKPGQWYWAIGHAHGAPFQTQIALYATYAKAADGKRILVGPYNVIPGMSGGPVLNAAGEVVGTVNAYNPDTPISLSRELKGSPVCR